MRIKEQEREFVPLEVVFESQGEIDLITELLAQVPWQLGKEFGVGYAEMQDIWDKFDNYAMNKPNVFEIFELNKGE